MIPFSLFSQDGEKKGVYLNRELAEEVYKELLRSDEKSNEIYYLNNEIAVLDSLYDLSIQIRQSQSSQLSLSISKIESLERSLDLKYEEINVYQNEIKKHKTHKIIIIAAAIIGILHVK